MAADWVRDVAVALAAGSVPALFGYLTSTRRARTLANGVASRTTREEFAALYAEARQQLEDARRTINDLRNELQALRLELDLERQQREQRDQRLDECEEKLQEETKERGHLEWIVDQLRRGRDPGEDKKRGRR